MSIRALLISGIIDSASSRPDAELALGLKRKGVDVDVMMPERSVYRSIFEEAGIRVISGHPPRKISCRSISWIREEIREKKYQIIHLFNSNAIVNGTFAATGLPVKVIAYRGAAGLYWYDPTAWLAHLNPRINTIVCNSGFVQQHVRKQLLFRKDNTTMIHKGMDLSWFSDVQPVSRKELNVPEDAVIVGCIANFRKIKGVDYLVKATWHMDPALPAHLLLIGSGMDSDYMTRLINKSPFKDRIHLLGFRKDVYSLTAACDIYVQPSLSESLSRSVMEAMSIGVPCVVSDAGGLTELVMHGESGLIVEKANELQLAQALEKMVKDPDLRTLFAKEGQQRMKDIFSVENMVNNTYKLYNSFVS